MTDHYEMPHRRADECPHAGVGKACRPCRELFETKPAPITPDERAAMRERYTADLSHLRLADYERRVLLLLGKTAREDVQRLLDALDSAEAEVAWLRPRVLPNPQDGCACAWHEQTSGPGYVEIIREDEPACPEHSDYLYDPRAGQWVARPATARDEDTVIEAVARWLHADACSEYDYAWEPNAGTFRDQARGLLAVVREHLPVRPDREAVRLVHHRALMPQAMSIFAAVGGTQADYDALLDTLADAVLALWPGESRATVQAEALRDAADEWGADPDAVGDSPADYRNWLRARADRLAPKEK